MRLVRPDTKYKDSYLAAIREAQAEGRKTEFDFDLAENHFERFVRELNEHAEGKHMKEGYVPETVLWLVGGMEYIGRVSIRHRLNDHLLKLGGHIGYDIRRSMRNKGYGTMILKLALPKAKELGIERALLTCDKTNIASRKIIEKNGGVLENKGPNPEGGPDKLRFWIDIA
ncbi:GNAT family N-acetyltransferase [Candidatus Parcubacteria bacterium]|nr:MAG: GNAT family N-acetyltransferase [Candidatus Parcubacteria bacterium]